MTDDRRLIEDYLPIQAIGAEASRVKSVQIYDAAAKLDHTKREIVAAGFYEVPAEVVGQATKRN